MGVGAVELMDLRRATGVAWTTHASAESSTWAQFLLQTR